MRPFNPAAAMARFASLVVAGALIAAPGLGRTEDRAPKASPPPGASVKTVAQRPAEAASEPSVLRVELSNAGAEARVVNLALGKSAAIELPVDARDVLVTNPAVADAVLRTRRRISVLGVAPGETDAVFFDPAGKRIVTLDIRVGKDSSGLAAALDRLLPGAKVKVESVNDSLVLAGEVATSADADKARRLA